MWGGTIEREEIRCEEPESEVRLLGHPLVDRKPMKIKFARKVLCIFHQEKHWSPLFTSHIGGGLDRVDISMHRTSGEWLIYRTSVSRKSISLKKGKIWLGYHALRDLPYSNRIATRRTRQVCYVRSPNIITMDAERKIVVSDEQRQITAISRVKAPWDTLKSIWAVSSVTCHYFRIVWVRELRNW